MKILTATALTFATLAAPAFAESPVLIGELNGESLLMDAQKMTLYTFDKDEKGVSNCYEGCIENWPAPGDMPGDGVKGVWHTARP